MSHSPSVLFVSTPTSGTGSLWRLLSAMTCGMLQPVKISEQYMIEGRLDALTQWVPEATGKLYLYNTPHLWPIGCDVSALKVMINFRDPRDLSCNQYQWAFQHPMIGKTDEQIAIYRENIAKKGIDGYVSMLDNRPLFKAIFDIVSKKHLFGEHKLLVMSYCQLCLRFEELVRDVQDFLGVVITEDMQKLIDLEHVDQLVHNPYWIGQMWYGTDTTPGRYKDELQPQTIALLNDTYHDVLEVLKSADKAMFKHYYEA